MNVVIACLCAVLLVSCGTGSNAGDDQPLSGGITIIDSLALNAADIPDAVRADIREMDVYFEHASVGSNISEGIDALVAESGGLFAIGRNGWSAEGGEVSQGIIDWYTAHDGFGDNARGNPGFASKIAGFDSRMRTEGFAEVLDVASWKFCYIDNDYAGSVQDAFDAVRVSIEALEEDFPHITFVWWTMPICTGGDSSRDDYNELVRAYCVQSGRYLIDIADIECHDPAGNRLVDDEMRELLYSGYTNDGGHLNGSGAERLAFAWWVALARIRGWE